MQQPIRPVHDETRPRTTPASRIGIDAARLPDDVLLRELEHLHRTRHDTFLYGSRDALEQHSIRTHELELEYLRRHPRRHIAAGRTRAGARARVAVEG
jgi:hypothetical protein